VEVGERHRFEERLLRVLGAARVGLMGWDTDTGQLMLSQPALKLLGLPPAALPLTVEDVVALVHPEDRDRMLGVLGAWRGRTTPLRTEVRVCRPQGDWRWLAVEGFEDEEGALVVLRDVHELRTREESETRYRFVVDEAAKDGVFDWDLQTGGLYWNDRMLDIVGVTREQFDPLHAHELFHPDDVQAMDAAKEAHFGGRTPLFEVEHRMRHSSGGYRTVLTRGRALRSPQGTPVRMVGIVTDLTEERALAESEERYRFALQAIDVGVLDWDVRADAVHWDERLAQMCGWPQSGSPDGAWVLERVHPADREPVRTAVRMALAEPRDVQVEARVRDADGRYRWLQLAGGSQAGDSGRVERIAGIVRDISDLRRVEEHRRRLARDLHDSVAQELATSATYADTALTVIAPTLPSQQRALLEALGEQMMRASDHMRRLIGALRDPNQLNGAPPLAAMASELAADLQEQTGAAVDVHVGLPVTEPLDAGASEAIEYVLREALRNVEKHADASAVSVELALVEGAVRVTVTDDGRGFEVGALDDNGGHYGLVGMRERLVDAGGDLTVHSAPGEGTTLAAVVPSG
jgi:PAS domain S-box-containing protein